MFSRSNPTHLDYIHYHQWGLRSSFPSKYNEKVAERFNNPTLKSFQETIKELGHENRTIDLFKIDCEGCEWTTYEDWIDFDIRQLQIEVHGLSPKGVGMFERFQASNFALFSKENNPHSSELYELSFVKLAPEFWLSGDTTTMKENEWVDSFIHSLIHSLLNVW